jgi:hypothetical protein
MLAVERVAIARVDGHPHPSVTGDVDERGRADVQRADLGHGRILSVVRVDGSEYRLYGP